MKFGIRKISFNKRIAARTSLPRFFRHSVGLKAPRGYGWLTNPKKAAYNRIYNRTTIKGDTLVALGIGLLIAIIGGVISLLIDSFSSRDVENINFSHDSVQICPRCGSRMILRNGSRGKFYGCSRFPRCRGTLNYIEINPKS